MRGEYKRDTSTLDWDIGGGAKGHFAPIRGSGAPHQRRRSTFAEDTQNPESTIRHGEAPAARVQCTGLSGRSITLSGSLAIVRMRSTVNSTTAWDAGALISDRSGSRQLNTGNDSLQNRQEISQRVTTRQGSQTEGRGESGGGDDVIGRAVATEHTGGRRVGGPDASPWKRAQQERRPVGKIPPRRKKNHSASRTLTHESGREPCPPLPPGAGSGSRHPGHSAGDGGRGWRGRTQALPGRGRGSEMEPGENDGVSDVVPSPFPEGAAPNPQDTRRAVEDVAQMRFLRESTQARGQIGNRAPLAVRLTNSGLRWLLSIPSGATPGAQDPGDAGSRPRSTPTPLREQHLVRDA